MLTDQPNDEVDDVLLAATIVASLRLRLLVLHEALQPFAYQLHDGVDDALLLEIVATTPATSLVAAVVVPIAPPVLMPVMTSAVMPIMAAAVMPIATAVVMPITTAAVVPIATAVMVLVPASVPGARPDQALERLQSFEDLVPIVVPHGSPPLCGSTLANAR